MVIWFADFTLTNVVAMLVAAERLSGVREQCPKGVIPGMATVSFSVVVLVKLTGAGCGIGWTAIMAMSKLVAPLATSPSKRQPNTSPTTALVKSYVTEDNVQLVPMVSVV